MTKELLVTRKILKSNLSVERKLELSQDQPFSDSFFCLCLKGDPQTIYQTDGNSEIALTQTNSSKLIFPSLFLSLSIMSFCMISLTLYPGRGRLASLKSSCSSQSQMNPLLLRSGKEKGWKKAIQKYTRHPMGQAPDSGGETPFLCSNVLCE